MVDCSVFGCGPLNEVAAEVAGLSSDVEAIRSDSGDLLFSFECHLLPRHVALLEVVSELARGNRGYRVLGCIFEAAHAYFERIAPSESDALEGALAVVLEGLLAGSEPDEAPSRDDIH